VRELKNVMERAVILSKGKVLRLDLAMTDLLEQSGREAAPGHPAVSDQVMTEHELRELEKKNMLAALRLADWRVSGPSGAAQLIGLKPTTFTDRMKKLGIVRPGLRQAG